MVRYKARFNPEKEPKGGKLLPSGVYLVRITKAETVQRKTECVKLLFRVEQPLRYINKSIKYTLSFKHSLFEELINALGYLSEGGEVDFDTEDFINSTVTLKMTLSHWMGQVQYSIVHFYPYDVYDERQPAKNAVHKKKNEAEGDEEDEDETEEPNPL